MEKIIKQIEIEIEKIEKEKIKNELKIEKLRRIIHELKELNSVKESKKIAEKVCPSQKKEPQSSFRADFKEKKPVGLGMLKINPEIGDYIKENSGKIGNIQLSKNIKEIFNVNITDSGVKNYKKRNGIKGIGRGKYFKNDKPIKKKIKRPFIFTKEVISFMKKCSEQEMTLKECLNKAELEFEYGFSISSFRKCAINNKILFRIKRINNLEMFDQKIIDLIRNNKEKSFEEIRDEIIEKLGVNFNVTDIRKILDTINPERIGEIEKPMTHAEIKKAMKDIGDKYEDNDFGELEEPEDLFGGEE